MSVTPPTQGERRAFPVSRRAWRRFAWLALSLVLSLTVTFLCQPGGLLYPFELRTLDMRYRSYFLPVAPKYVALVAIDERSVNDPALGRWPWPRRRHAELIAALSSDKPQAIVFDILFAETSSPAEDMALAQACRKAGNVYLACHVAPLRPRALEADMRNKFTAHPRLLAHRALLPDAAAIIPPQAMLAQAAAGGGVVATTPDPDGVVRRGLLFVRERVKKGELIYPTLLWRLLAAATKTPLEEMEIDLRHEARLGAGRRVPLDGQGGFLISFVGPPGSIPSFSYLDVLQHRFAPGTFRDKIVFVGFTAEGLLDQHPTPLGPKMPGVELQAQALESLLQERYLRRVSPTEAFAIALVITALASASVAFLRPIIGLLSMILLLVGYNIFSLHLFQGAGLLWPGLAPNLATIVAASVVSVWRLRTEEAARRRLRDEFARYAPPQVVARLDAGEMEERSAGVKRPITALFADVRDFTQWSATADPHEVVAILNTYFETVTRLAFDLEATVDNIVGDEIFVTFNALQEQPDHVARAVDLALNIVSALEGLNARWLATGALAAPLRIGIGLNTGEALVGTLGSHIRRQYTVLGSVVNLAARLQAYNKELGTTILCTRAVAEQVAGRVIIRSHGLHTIRGHPEPIEVFEIVGRMGTLRKDEPRSSGAMAFP